MLILPFAVVGGRASDSWLARSVQQAMLTDLVTSGPVRAATGATAAADPAAAAEAGRAADARYVLAGSIHVNDRPDYTAVRVTGQVIDPATGRALGTIKATGSLDDLFGLEDEVTDQARRQLAWLEGEAAATRPAPRPAPLPGRSQQPPAATTPAPSIEPSGPVRFGDYAGDAGYAVPDYSPTVPPAALYRYYYGDPYAYSGPTFYSVRYSAFPYSYSLGNSYRGRYFYPYYRQSGLSIGFTYNSSNFGLRVGTGGFAGGYRNAGVVQSYPAARFGPQRLGGTPIGAGAVRRAR